MSYYNQQCRDDFKVNRNSCIAWYLMSSFGYYKEAESFLSDDVFDKMCLYIYNNWESLDHKLKFLVPKESLTAGTGFDISFNEYPQGLLRLIYKMIGGMQ